MKKAIRSIGKLLVVLLVLNISVTSFAITYTYDDLNRLISVRYDNGKIVTYEYDSAGNITKVSSSNYESEKDATLKDILIDGLPLRGFSSDILDYELTLSSSSAVVPYVEAKANNKNAIVVIEHAKELPGTTVISVTAQDGVSKKEYRVHFLVESTLETIYFGKTDIVLANGTTDILNVISNDGTIIDPSTLSWYTDDDTVVTVNSGKITAVGIGATIVKATTDQNDEIQCRVKVVEQPNMNGLLSAGGMTIIIEDTAYYRDYLINNVYILDSVPKDKVFYAKLANDVFIDNNGELVSEYEKIITLITKYYIE